MSLFALDIRTTLQLLFIGNLISVAMLIGYKQIGVERSYKIFLVSKIFQALAWILLGLRDQIPYFYSVQIANPLLFSGFALEAIAFLSIDKHRKGFESLIATLVVSGSFAFWVLATTLALRIAIASTVTVAIYATAAVAILLISNKSRLHCFVALFYGLFCSVLLFRAYTAFQSSQNLTLLSTGVVQSLSFYSVFCFMLVGGVGFLLLLKQKSDNELLSAATKDSLTGILNRRAFLDNAELAVSMAVRTQRQITLLVIDIDHFKKINDSYGHPVGDTVLGGFTKGVQRLLRPHDLFGRIGGEEFAVLLSDSSNNVMNVAERIRTFAEEQSFPSISNLSYSISIGVVTLIPESQRDLEKMLLHADKALYEAKRTGRNRVCIAKSLINMGV